MPLNPKLISVSQTDADAQAAATKLDTDVATAVAYAKTQPGILLNQITIVPLGTIYNVTDSAYVASASVLYSTT